MPALCRLTKQVFDGMGVGDSGRRSGVAGSGYVYDYAKLDGGLLALGVFN